ncbi:LysR family transcriptional regulator [Corallincola platygyrae]|uniref:LysR family transcriptional regulator n=1 Tax=Corallincola platygyrae TaxID=1193278 RepID=A0ABW4XL91_9GAMM
MEQNRFTLDQLRALLIVVEKGSFSAAARHLGKAQSVLSHHIQNLEIDLDIILFDRSGRYPTLTPAGEAVVEQAKFLLQQADHLSGVAKSLQEYQREKLVIAADEMALDGRFDPSMLALSQTFPHLSVEICHPVLKDVATMVREGRADIGLTVQMSDVYDDLAFARLGATKMVVIVETGHALTELGTLDTIALARYRQVLVSGTIQENSPWQLSPLCWRVSSIWGAVELAKAGVGWTIVPAFAAKDGIAQGKLAVLTTKLDPPEWELPSDLIWRHDARIDGVMEWVINRLCSV